MPNKYRNNSWDDKWTRAMNKVALRDINRMIVKCPVCDCLEIEDYSDYDHKIYICNTVYIIKERRIIQ